jgi:hypothetical protein
VIPFVLFRFKVAFLVRNKKRENSEQSGRLNITWAVLPWIALLFWEIERCRVQSERAENVQWWVNSCKINKSCSLWKCVCESERLEGSGSWVQGVKVLVCFTCREAKKKMQFLQLSMRMDPLTAPEQTVQFSRL